AATSPEDRVIDVGEDRDRGRCDGLWNPGKVEGIDLGQRGPGGEELLAGGVAEHGAECGDRPAAEVVGSRPARPDEDPRRTVVHRVADQLADAVGCRV